MKENRNPLVLLLAFIGLCAVILGISYLYERETTKERARAAFSAPAPSGFPDWLNATPGPPPPQP